jgi:hypothetical protein
VRKPIEPDAFEDLVVSVNDDWLSRVPLATQLA